MKTSLRRLLLLLVLLAGGLAMWLSIRQRREVNETLRPPPAAGGKQAPLQASRRESVPGGHPLAAELNAPTHTTQRDLQILHEMIFAFTTTLKSVNLPPLGDNQDITAALTGRNRRKLVVIPPDHPALDARGCLLDRWGTPYHFHARSAESFDLRSAGPDKVLFTDDDVAWSPR